MSGDEGQVRIEATFRDSGATGEIEIRQLALGMTPCILIEPEVDGDDVILQVDATDLEQEELAYMLRTIADAVDRGVVREETHETDT